MISADELILIIIVVIVITIASAFSSRVGVAGPLVLVVIGVVVSFVPAIPPIQVEPELILVGVLPPLLYSAAASAPAVEFRRDLRAITGLATVLVVVSSVVVGLFFFWMIPSLGLPLAIALGAILSPTDAVATSIVRKLGVSRRVVTLLEGESLLNDASALVILRTAIAATAAGFSAVATLGAFAWAILSAIAVGGAVGFLALRVRSWTRSATISTAFGFTVPFVAYLPTDAIGGSGLVAAVIAGVVCGQGASRWLTPEQRISDKLSWRTVAFILEGAVFLLMGLELDAILGSIIESKEGIGRGMWLALCAFLILIAVRAAYVIPVIRYQSGRAKRRASRRVDAGPPPETGVIEQPRNADSERSPALITGAKRLRRARSRRRFPRVKADATYFENSPLSWKHSVVIVWAGMRGVVTLAAAQTLPRDIPERDLLTFIAFVVAAGSLLLQRTTLPVVARALGLQQSANRGHPYQEINALDAELRAAVQQAVTEKAVRRRDHGPFSDDEYLRWSTHLSEHVDFGASDRDALEFELALIGVMRRRYGEIVRSGRYSSSAVQYTLDELDANEIGLRMRMGIEE